MSKTRLSPIAAITLIIVSIILGLDKVPLSSAFAPAENANPRIIYWPAPKIWQTADGHIVFESGGIYANSLSWSSSGELLLIAASDRFVVINASTMSLIHEFANPMGYVSQSAFNSFVISSGYSKIFYVNTSWYTAPSSTIYSMNLDGSNPTLITYVNSCSTSVPTFFDLSNDGTFLIYTELDLNYSSYPYSYLSRICKINLNTNEKSLVLELDGQDNQILSVRFSPSNDKIAFTTYNDIWTINPDGTEITMVTDLPEGSIATDLDWMSNGTMLTYTEINCTVRGQYGPSIGYGSNSTVKAVNVDGSNKHTIYQGVYCWVWSPLDASIAAFIKPTRNVPYLINLSLPITPNPDSDGDGLSDGVEIKVFRTDPAKTDTDGDGISDGLEAAATGLSAFVSVLPEGWIRMTLQWSNKTMYVSTNSSVLGVVFNSTSMALSVSVGGPDGTTGIANITIPIEMISSLSAVQVTLDNQPIDFQITQVGSNAQIKVQYHHSFHKLTAHLQGGGGIGGVDLTGILGYWWLILSIAIIAVAAVIAAIIVKRG